ncbi:MAG TPA: bifunctional glutamate N-acetyltransferase/amino-acid acetyltransferase ArgJ [Candidatus Hydrogenedentes bacterium]|nr:bifunctional glutamate N-acetyltransferase/amino-acid acetyltransferase ArgJ [Candidatus Hydrogenedentota bacterium]
MTSIEGGVTAPTGFRASGAHAGIKKDPEKLDCALIMSSAECSVAGVFTQNLMKSPPVFWNIDVCARGSAQAIFINSGNANAATGQRGHDDVKAMAGFVANGAPFSFEEVCICSTGVIGVPLPMRNIENGIDDCIDSLSDHGSPYAAQAIMTTDTVQKERAIEIEIAGKPVRLGAIAKGSGMISPKMATMICILTTDAAIPSNLLDELLKASVEVSFNQIGIDNDMSTSDTVLVFANRKSPAPEIQKDSPESETFATALTALCQDMAKDLVKDGEGATKFIEITVKGTKNNQDAKIVSRAIGNSQLCKTAFFGQDPNWGRFACAAGYAGVDFEPADLTIAVNDVVLCEKGEVAQYREEDAAAVMHLPEFVLHVSIGRGDGSAVYWTSDLSHDYVSINADYRS